MQITASQFKALSEAQVRGFEGRVITHLRTFFSDASLPREQELRLFIRGGVDFAARHGISGERDVCKLVTLMLAVGPDMIRNSPTITRLLGDPALPSAAERVSAVYDLVLSYLDKQGA